MFLSRGYLEEVGVASDRRLPVPVAVAPNGPPASATEATPKEQGAKAPAIANRTQDPKAESKGEKQVAKADKNGEKQDAKADKKGAKAGAVPGATVSVPTGPFTERTPEEIKKMSKEERTAYHKARIASQSVEKPAEQVQLSKIQRREMQEAQRKVKDMKLQSGDAHEELIKELKLQGLTEDQAREVASAMAKEAAEAEANAEEDDDDEEEDLLASVARWMREQGDGTLPSDSWRDFNLKVRFQGHVESTPPDHIICILHVLCQNGSRSCDLSKPKVQPGAVAKSVGPSITRYAALLEPMYAKIDDVMIAADVVVMGVRNGVAAVQDASEDARESAVVGCLMALRGIDMIEDEDMLMGCRRIEAPSVVMQKFVEFLEDAVESDDEDGSGED